MSNEVRLNTIDYTTKDGTTWKANILSHSIEESVALIRKKVSTFDRVYGTSAGKTVNDLTDKVKKSFVIIREVSKPDEESDEEINVLFNDDGIICPFCDKTFKSKMTFKNHLIKYHT